MLVKFSLRNYKVFREKVELSLIASNYDKDTNEANVFEVPKFGLRLLKSAVVYGANASGKSKLINALNFMRIFIKDSFKDKQKGDIIPVEPFLLSTLSDSEPSEFEVTFIYENILYRYGFEVTQREVVSEWLYYRPNTKEIELFYRDRQAIDVHRQSFSKSVNQYVKDKSIRENALLLSAIAANYNDEHSGKVLAWFGDVGMISGLQESGYKGFTYDQMDKPDSDFKRRMLNLLKMADLGIQEVIVEKVEGFPDNFPEALKDLMQERIKDNKLALVNVQTAHPKYNEANQVIGNVLLSMNEDESSGTQKFFALTGPILDSLEEGSVFVADELDAKMHPNLVCEIVQLFHSPATNPKNAQLIFNTHDTNLLSADMFRRDQIWFTEKDRYGAATLFSLADFKVRSGENFERNYVRGKYGAIPYLGDFSRLSNASEQIAHAGTEE